MLSQLVDLTVYVGREGHRPIAMAYSERYEADWQGHHFDARWVYGSNRREAEFEAAVLLPDQTWVVLDRCDDARIMHIDLEAWARTIFNQFVADC